MEQKDLLIGIDLGTSRTAVVSSRGAREVFKSAVAYPKDLIGVKLLGNSHVVGDEALGRSFLDVNFPLKDGVLKVTGDHERDAARKLIAYSVAQADPQEEDRVCAVIGVPANASGFNQELVLELAKDSVDIALVVSEPFLVAYGLDKLMNSIIIDIGAGTTDLCALKGRLPKLEDQASNVKAGDYIDELLMSAISLRYPGVQLNKQVVKAIKERYATVLSDGDKIKVTLREEGKPVVIDITEEVRFACQSIVPEIIEHVEYLIAGFNPVDQTEALQNIIIAGGGSKITGINTMVAESLSEYGEVNVSCVEDVVYSGCAGALQLATEFPPESWNDIGGTIGA